MHKKQKLTSEKEKDLDLEKIMEDSDTLPDIVCNRPVAQTENGDTSDCEIPMNNNTTPTTLELSVLDTELSGVTRSTDNNNVLPGVTSPTNNNNHTILGMSNERTAKARGKDTVDNSVLTEEIAHLVNPVEAELKAPNTLDSHDTVPPSPQSSVNEEPNLNEYIEGETEQNNRLLGITETRNGVTDVHGKFILDTTVNNTVEPMEIETNSELSEPKNKLFGRIETGNVITESLHGITDLNVLDHSYSRQSVDCSTTNPDYYATTEDEDDAIDALLRLSAADTSLVEFPGDNSQLLTIGASVPDVAPTDINIETAAVTTTIENIALQETVTKTTITVSTQTMFARPKNR